MMKRYNSFKDSGIDWIGEVPEKWVPKKLKYLFDTVIGGAWGDDPVSNDNDMVVFRVADFDYNKGILSTDNLTFRNIPESQQSNRVLKYGDIILEKSGGGEKTPVGRAVMYTHEQIQAVCANFCNRLSPKHEYSPAFVSYIFKYLYTKGVTLKYINQTTGIQNLQSEALLNETAFLPAFDEQNFIAGFLDNKTSQIDSLIQKKQEMIALLEEEKTAVINEAVTKGLNPDAPMKDSGIDWLGVIPEHWEIKKLKYLVTLINEKGAAEGINHKVALENIESCSGKLLDVELSFEFNGEGSLFKEGDVLFNKLRPYLAKVYLAKEEGVAGGELLILRTNQLITSVFLFYRLLSSDFIKEVNSSTYGSKMPRASWSFIEQLLIPYPALPEQEEIIKLIVSEIKRIDLLKTKALHEIDLLQEYRTALISEAVTGKIDVRDYQPEPISLPELV